MHSRLQARAAARIPPSIWMNPVLLKPASDTGARVIIFWGKALQQLEGITSATNPKPRKRLSCAYARLTQDYERVVIEVGAGSPRRNQSAEGISPTWALLSQPRAGDTRGSDIDRGGCFCPAGPAP
ncbi:MAG: hypothetical protein IPM37_07315 [Hahellaceae bacterium]|nr:hypothetical protein [Hahellaceae bacterium]